MKHLSKAVKHVPQWGSGSRKKKYPLFVAMVEELTKAIWFTNVEL